MRVKTIDRGLAVDEVAGDGEAIGLLGDEEVVLRGVGELVDRVDLVPAVLGQVATDELVDLAVERGREQEALAVGRGGREQAVDRLVEAEVAEVVGLVEHRHLDGVEMALATLDEVAESPGVAMTTSAP